jgi:type IX secretion system PorP/SprF family membrane protein
MKRILVLVCCSVFTLTCVKAQDPHFSQFFSSPLTLNPALTGKFDGNFRIAGNYRDQWPAISKTFVTSTFSIDAPILTSRIQEIDALAIGVMGMNDRTANGILKSNFISASVAYHKGLDCSNWVLAFRAAMVTTKWMVLH